MTQKFYLHDAASTVTGTLPATGSSQSATTPNVTATGAGTNRSMNGTIGTAQVAISLATLAVTTIQANWFRRFVSPPIAAQTITGSWDVGVAGSSSNTTNSNFQWDHSLYLWRPSTGALVGRIFDQTLAFFVIGSTETGEGGGANLFATAQTAVDGDVLIYEIWGRLNQGMATSYTWTYDYDGTVEPTSGAISSAACYLLAPADIPLFTPSSFIAAKNKPILQAVNRAANWCKHERRESGLYVPRRRYFLPSLKGATS